MKNYKHLYLAAMIALTLSTAAQAKPKIKVLATGGTIAGAQASSSDVGYKSGTFSVDDLIKAVPQLKDIADLTGEQLANIGSQTMNHEVWLNLPHRVAQPLKSSDTDGAVSAANLYTAGVVAGNPEAGGLGPLIVLTDGIHYGREAENLNTAELNTLC